MLDYLSLCEHFLYRSKTSNLFSFYLWVQPHVFHSPLGLTVSIIVKTERSLLLTRGKFMKKVH